MKINRELVNERIESFIEKGTEYFEKGEYLASFSILFFGFELYIKNLFDFGYNYQTDYFSNFIKNIDFTFESLNIVIIEEDKKIKEISKISNTGVISDKKINIETDFVLWLFQVRHNLFHGNKSNYRDKDKKLFKYGSKLIISILSKLINNK